MYDSERASKVIKFIKNLKHTKSPFYGIPFRMQPFQEEFLRELYGRVNDQGRRRYRQSLLFLPRKNGKSEVAAGVALYHLFADNVQGGEVYIVAGSREQAGIIFRVCADMIRQSKPLREVSKITESRKNIANYRNGSFLRAVPSDSATLMGLNPSLVVADEFAFWPGQKGRGLWESLTTGGGTRSEPLTLAITTAGIEQNSVCKDVFDYAVKVRDGIVDDPTFLPWIYQADEKLSWDDPAAWRAANPALGTFRQIDELETLARRAKEIPSLRASFERLYLNRWISTETTWLPIEKFDSCESEIPDLTGRDCFGGLDLSSTQDLSSFCLVFPLEDDTFAVKSFSWLPESRVMSRKDNVPYRLWNQSGWLDVTPGEIVDYNFIQRKILELSQVYRIRQIAFDRWNSGMLVNNLQDQGATMVGTGLGFASLSGPTKFLEELMLSQRLRHDGNPVLRWAVSNVTTEQDAAGNIKPSKAKSIQRIDPVVALILALSRVMTKQARPTIYKERGLIAL